MSRDLRDGARSDGARDPWRHAPTSELGDQVLPRWFVLTAMALVPVAAAVLWFAFFGPRDAPLPVEARRPPPAGGYTTAVGAVETAPAEVTRLDTCPLLDGVGVAAERADLDQLRRGLAGLCDIELPDEVRAAIRDFAQAGGVVRFATFEMGEIDSTAALDTPTVLINARFARTDAGFVAPLFVHDVVARAGTPATAVTALEARDAEALVCDRLLAPGNRSRGCVDAATIQRLDDPLAALRAAGYE